MIVSFLEKASINIFKGFGNTLLNGFASDVSEKDKADQMGLQLAHFNPISKWSKEKYESITPWSWKKYEIVDESNGDRYCDDSIKNVRLKCIALFAASWIVQPIGLALNLVNRIAKIVTGAHFWHPSEEKYNFKASIGEWRKDILLVVSTPLILVGMIFSALYGATLSPYDGRKLYATFERLAYSGGYQFFGSHYSEKNLHNYLLAPCFQPDPKAHLGGGDLSKSNEW